MKRLLIALLVFVVSAGALAAEEGEQGRGRRYGRGRGKASVRMLAAQLPGAYSLLPRLDLSDEQKEVLAEIYGDWAKAKRAAWKKVQGRLPRMSREDWQDPDKRAAYREVRDKVQPAPPVDKVANVLSPEQLGKILKVNEVTAEFQKWLVELLTAYEKKLDAEVGKLPEQEDKAAWRRDYKVSHVLSTYARGAGGLAERLGLTEKQEEALRALYPARHAPWAEQLALLGAVLNEGKLERSEAASIRTALTSRVREDANARTRKEVGEILTRSQERAIDKGLSLLEDRDGKILERYTTFAESVDAVLPPPRDKAGVVGYPYVRYGGGQGRAGGRVRIRQHD
ncbi:MAG: hypothetical protein R6V58_06915 [Planctomycetota bacterium]